jgi:hypothetical protein
MKILVATNEKQTAPRDFCWTEEKEIVKFPYFECSNKCTCGCNRSWVGTQSSRSTTTAKVIPSTITVNELAEIIYNSLVKEGWLAKNIPDSLKKGIVKKCKSDAKEIFKITSRRKIGAIVRRQDNRIFDAY